MRNQVTVRIFMHRHESKITSNPGLFQTKIDRSHRNCNTTNNIKKYAKFLCGHS